MTQLDLLALIDADPVHTTDSARIKAAILADGRAHGGRIDMNRVRRALTNSSGHLDVYPRCVGPAYNALVAAKQIVRLGYLDVNQDHAGRNAGKPQMAYKLAAYPSGGPAEAPSSAAAPTLPPSGGRGTSAGGAS